MGMSGRLWCLIGFLMCAGMIVFAFILQHVFDLEPCPLCIFQRIAVIVAGICFLPGIFYRPYRSAALWGGLALLSSLAGIALAARHLWLQSLPADQVPSCGPPLDYMLESLPLWNVLRQVLSGSGECAEIQGIFLGITLPGWTMIGFIVLGIVACGALFSAFRKRDGGSPSSKDKKEDAPRYAA